MTSTLSDSSASGSSPITLAHSSGLNEARRSQVKRFFLTVALTFLGVTIAVALLLGFVGTDDVWVGRVCVALLFVPSVVMIAMGIFMRDLGPLTAAPAT